MLKYLTSKKMYLSLYHQTTTPKGITLKSKRKVMNNFISYVESRLAELNNNDFLATKKIENDLALIAKYGDANSEVSNCQTAFGVCVQLGRVAYYAGAEAAQADLGTSIGMFDQHEMVAEIKNRANQSEAREREMLSNKFGFKF